MGLGEKLREARLAAGYSVDQVAQGTKMVSQMVKEIEENDFHRFPAPIYGRGFIKLFAEFVGLDPEPLVREYSAAGNSKVDAPMVSLEIIDKESGALSRVCPEGMTQTPPKAQVLSDRAGQSETAQGTERVREVKPETSVPDNRMESLFAHDGANSGGTARAQQPTVSNPVQKNFVIAAMPAKPAGSPDPMLTSEEVRRRAAAEAGEASRAPEKPRVFDYKPEPVTMRSAPQPTGVPVKPFVYPLFEPVDPPPEEPEVGPEPARPGKKLLGGVLNGETVPGVAGRVSDWFARAVAYVMGLFSSEKESDDSVEGVMAKKYRVIGIAAAAVVGVLLLVSVFSGGNSPSGQEDAVEPDEDAAVEPAAVSPVLEEPDAAAEEPAEILRILRPPLGFAE